MKSGTVCTTCGNGIMIDAYEYDIYEECDDGNNDNGDGCSSNCRVESGYECTTYADDGEY